MLTVDMKLFNIIMNSSAANNQSSSTPLPDSATVDKNTSVTLWFINRIFVSLALTGGSYLRKTQLYLTRVILVQGLEGVCLWMKYNIRTLL